MEITYLNKYRIYKDVYKTVIQLKDNRGYSYEEISIDKLIEIDVSKLVGFRLCLYDKFVREVFVKELYCKETLNRDDDLVVEGEISYIRKKVFDTDNNCYNLYTGKRDLIDLEEGIMNIFRMKKDELELLNLGSRKAVLNKDDTKSSNASMWDKFIKKIF